jgi:hypothetical protein
MYLIHCDLSSPSDNTRELLSFVFHDFVCMISDLLHSLYFCVNSIRNLNGGIGAGGRSECRSKVAGTGLERHAPTVRAQVLGATGYDDGGDGTCRGGAAAGV